MTEMHDQNRVFEALANEHRREFIGALSLHPHSISQLAAMRGLSLPAIHKHVAVLENADLVVRKKVGRTNFLALNRAPMRGLQEWLSGFNLYWGSEAETLDNYARQMGTRQPTEEGQQ